MQREYKEKTIQRVLEWAQNQATLTQMASYLGLEGRERLDFIKDALNKDHPLGKAFAAGTKDGYDDVFAALHTAALSGDSDAAELIAKFNMNDKVECIKYKLFGI